MEDRAYHSLSRHSLASSNSQLDGVPFKIGQNFLQSPKVVEPPDLYRSNVSKVLNVEYTFETEEAVLAWATAKEEAVRKAAEEESKRLAEEQRKQEAEKAEETHSKPDIRSDADEAESTNQSDGNVYDVPKSSTPSLQSHVDLEEKPRVPPKPAGRVKKQLTEPGTILKPTPVHSSTNSVVGKKMETSPDNKIMEADSVFDVSMFESEADPFDNLELQTLNDMEELKILLDSSSKSSADSAATETNTCLSQTSSDKDSTSVQHKDSASETIYDMAMPVKENTWETFSDDSPECGTTIDRDLASQRGKTPSPSLRCADSNDTSGQAREDDEYVEITTSYKAQSVSFQNHAINGVSKTTNLGNWSEKSNTDSLFGGKLPAGLANSKLYKPVLPPFSKPECTATDNSSPNTNPFLQSSAQETNPFLSQTTKDAQNPFLQDMPNQWVSFSNISESGDTESKLPGEQNSSSQKTLGVSANPLKSSLLPPPPPASRPPRNRQSVANARMWSSVGPSLAASFDESSSVSSNTLDNPYSRHSLSSSDLHLTNTSSDRSSPVLQKFIASQSPSQPWNRHRPLPPIPTPSSAAALTPTSYKVSLLPPSQQVGLTDPYHSLSREAQTFTDSLTSMGFLRARVARAVVKFGQDEKEVIDHLIAADMLLEKKYAPVLVESALNTFKNDVEKAEKFLQMLTQFEELGFSSDKIQEALVSSGMDYDKVLDILTT